MKYLMKSKSFTESILETYKTRKKFWLVRTDSPYLEISLDKLNIKNKYRWTYFTVIAKMMHNQHTFIDNKNIKEYRKTSPFICIGYNFLNNLLEWDYYENKDVFESCKYKFGGNIDVEDWELDTLKYNL